MFFLLLPLFLTALGLGALFTYLWLSGPSLRRYDTGEAPRVFNSDTESEGYARVLDFLHKNFTVPAQSGTKDRGALAAKRARFERFGTSRDFAALHGVNFQPAIASYDGIDVTGEWVTTPNGDPDARILYIHGGAFTVGSAISHRAITSQIAKATGASVFAPNYRLMPENSRAASIEDCQAVYRWALEFGPRGQHPAASLAYGGDSAGGNLSLMLSNWIKASGYRPANAVFCLSPATDTTASSPSIRSNIDRDIMLKPLVAPLLKIPRWLYLLGARKALGFRPCDPLISPLMADLTRLPPTLLQFSESELMRDDSLRYFRKAAAANSPVTAQMWTDMPHVWQLFDEDLPEARAALEELYSFLRLHMALK